MTKKAVAAMIAGIAIAATASAQGTTTLSAADRAQIQQLGVRYAETLSACAADDYAALFTPDGYFESGFRGKAAGPAKLVELVRSERHCTGPGSRPVTPVPATEITPTADGASGRVVLPNNGGAYEDAYVKTAGGWRFKSRSYLTSKELAARASH